MDQATEVDPRAAFRDAMEAAGLPAPAKIVADNALHRFSTSESGQDDAGWYVFDDSSPRPSGIFGCWRTGIQGQWRMDGSGLSAEKLREARVRREADRKRREEEAAREQAEAEAKAAGLWKAGSPGTHPYLDRKGVGAYGVRVWNRLLLIPMRDVGGKLRSLQFITSEGGKRYLTGGKVKACYHAIGKPDGLLYIAEGYATAASVHEATSCAVAVAFSAGNLSPVAEVLSEKLGVRIIVAADNDESGVGQMAARDVGETRVPPEVGDWNDYVLRHGREAAAEALK